MLAGCSPEELYTGFYPREATESERWTGSPALIDGPKCSGNPALDSFTQLVHKHMGRVGVGNIADELQVSHIDLRGMVRALTGIDPREWQERYIVCAVRELIALPRGGMLMIDIARHLGYSRNGLFRLCERHRIELRWHRM